MNYDVILWWNILERENKYNYIQVYIFNMYVYVH